MDRATGALRVCGAAITAGVVVVRVMRDAWVRAVRGAIRATTGLVVALRLLPTAETMPGAGRSGLTPAGWGRPGAVPGRRTPLFLAAARGALTVRLALVTIGLEAGLGTNVGLTIAVFIL